MQLTGATQMYNFLEGLTHYYVQQSNIIIMSNNLLFQNYCT